MKASQNGGSKRVKIISYRLQCKSMLTGQGDIYIVYYLKLCDTCNTVIVPSLNSSQSKEIVHIVKVCLSSLN